MPLLWNAIRASVITLNTFPTAGCIKVNTLLNKPVRIVKPFLISSSNLSVQYLRRPTAISSTRSITEGSQERRIMSTLLRRICNFGKRVATLKAAQIKIKEIAIFDSPISSVSCSSGRTRWTVKKMLQRWYVLYVKWSRAKDFKISRKKQAHVNISIIGRINLSLLRWLIFLRQLKQQRHQ